MCSFDDVGTGGRRARPGTSSSVVQAVPRTSWPARWLRLRGSTETPGAVGPTVDGMPRARRSDARCSVASSPRCCCRRWSCSPRGRPAGRLPRVVLACLDGAPRRRTLRVQARPGAPWSGRCWRPSHSPSPSSRCRTPTGPWRQARRCPAPAWLVGPKGGSWMGVFVVFALLLLYFPDGRLPGPPMAGGPGRARVAFVVFEVGTALTPDPYQPPWQDVRAPGLDRCCGPLPMAVLPVFLVLLAAAAASLVVRYRRGGPGQRRQIRWLALASLAVPLTLALSWLGEAFVGESDVEAGRPPRAARHDVRRRAGHDRSRRDPDDLYDVDRAVVVASVYGGVGVVLLAVFTAVSAAAGSWRPAPRRASPWWSRPPSPWRSARCARRLVERGRPPPLPRAGRALSAVATLQHEVTRGLRRARAARGRARGPRCTTPSCASATPSPGRRECVDRGDAGSTPGPGGVPAVMGGHQVGVLVAGERRRPSVPPGGRRGLGLLIEMGRLRIELTRGAARGRGQPEPAGAGRLRGAPPPRARPARRCPAAAGVAGHGAAAGPAAPRRRHGRRRRPARRGGGRARHGRGRAAPDRARHSGPSSLDDGLAAALAEPQPEHPRRRSGLDVQAATCPTTSAPRRTSSPARRSRTRSSTPAPAPIAMSRATRRRARCACSVARRRRAAARSRGRVRAWPGSPTGSARSAGRWRSAAPPGGGTVVEAVLPCAS